MVTTGITTVIMAVTLRITRILVDNKITETVMETGRVHARPMGALFVMIAVDQDISLENAKMHKHEICHRET